MSADMYNFSLFENTPVNTGKSNAAPKIEEERKKPELIPLKGNKAFYVKQRRDKMRVAALLCGFTLLATAIGMQISAFAAIYEADKAIAQQEAVLAVAKSEQVRLNAELDGKSSIENIDSYAKNVLGMQKPENFQVNYVNLAQADNVILSGGKQYSDETPGIFSEALAYIQSFFA